MRNIESLDNRIASRLKGLRKERGWSLDELARRCGVSRATLSRLENGEISPTTTVLGQLCAAYEIPMSRLMAMAEEEFSPLIKHSDQSLWSDPENGFIRRSVSPPSGSLVGEVLHCEISKGQRIAYDKPPRVGMEHHLFVVRGRLHMEVDGQSYDLRKGDCLRYKLHGASLFETPSAGGVEYILAIL